MEPLPRGSDFEFEDDIFGGSIPRQFVPAVEKGIQDARMRGFLAGYPMVDFKATVFDGSYHPVDSNELSFKLAGSLAFKDAMTRARPTILEPIMKVEVYAPSDFAGDLMGDLNGRRGRIAGMDTRGAMTVIRAQVPMSEMLTYEQHLTSATGGRGSYHMEYSHYEEVPPAPPDQDHRGREGGARTGGGRGGLGQLPSPEAPRARHAFGLRRTPPTCALFACREHAVLGRHRYRSARDHEGPLVVATPPVVQAQGRLGYSC